MSKSGVSQTHCWVSLDLDPRAYGYKLYLVDPDGNTVASSGIETGPHFEFVFPTPSTIGLYTIYAPGSDGVNVNPVVPGITPFATVTLGTNDGTLDLAQGTPASMGLGLDSDGETLSVQIGGPLYEDISGNINLKIASDFVVSGGVLTQNAVDLAKSVNFDTGQFQVTGGALVVKALAVNKLIAGDALFAGDATFARSGGGKLTLNSSGLTIADHNTSPNATVTLASTGATIAKGSNNVQITASGVAINGPSGTLTATSSGVVIANGSSSVTVSPAAVTIANGSLSSPVITGAAISGSSLTVSGGGQTVNIDSTNFVKVTSSGGSFIQLLGATVQGGTGASGAFSLQDSGGNGTGLLAIYTHGVGSPGLYGGGLIELNGASPFIWMNGTQVLTVRQSDPGNATSTADIVSKFNSLLGSLRTHGLI